MVSKYRYGAMVLAGGEGKRMGGAEKAVLTCGTTTFLSILEKTLSPFSPLYLSANRCDMAEGTGFIPVADILPHKGPMGGIYSVLKQSSCDALLVLPCDMPCFPQGLAEYLFQQHGGEAVLYLETADGREYPLCGIYTRECLPVLEELIAKGDLRMRQVLRRVGGRKLTVPEEYADPGCLLNVNTPEIYEKVCKQYQEDKAEERYSGA